MKKQNPASYCLCIGQTDHRWTSWPQFNVSNLSQKHPYVTPTYVDILHNNRYFISRAELPFIYLVPKQTPCQLSMNCPSVENLLLAKTLGIKGRGGVSPFPVLPLLEWWKDTWQEYRVLLATHRRITIEYWNNSFGGFLSASNEVRKRGQVPSHCTAKFSLLPTQRQENLYVPKIGRLAVTLIFKA